MALGMDTIKKVLERINQIKDQMVELHERMQTMETTINEVNDRTERIESQLERQEQLLDTIADRRGIDEGTTPEEDERE
jgi:predicted  nucleic acid-binding Zn-ribbon protein